MKSRRAFQTTTVVPISFCCS